MQTGDANLVRDGDESQAVAPVPGGDDHHQGLLPLLDGQVELGGMAAAGPAERVVAGLGAQVP
jgi:hypothetical protein